MSRHGGSLIVIVGCAQCLDWKPDFISTADANSQILDDPNITFDQTLSNGDTMAL